MSLINLLAETPQPGPCVVGLGAFDGVHRGHQALIDGMKAYGAEQQLPTVIFTFDHSPRCLLSPEQFLGEITTPAEKFALLLGSGVEHVVFRPFDREFAMTSPESFISDLIVKKLQAQAVFVGFNFGFGLKRRGNVTLLRQLLQDANRHCHILSPVKVGDSVVSSSLIREAMVDGDVPFANRLLGRQFSFSGEVVHGDNRGREMGFPTANLDLEGTKKVLPPRGVYLCQCDTPLGTYPSLINIGVRPTFHRERLVLEAHLLDFQGNLYQRTIRVRFLKKLREEIQFPSKAHLIEQIRRDLDVAREAISTFSEGVIK